MKILWTGILESIKRFFFYSVELDATVTLNSSCSMGFLTQVPNSDFLKAENNWFLASWKALEANLASEYWLQSTFCLLSIKELLLLLRGLTTELWAIFKNRLKRETLANLEATPLSCKSKWKNKVNFLIFVIFIIY